MKCLFCVPKKTTEMPVAAGRGERGRSDRRAKWCHCYNLLLVKELCVMIIYYRFKQVTITECLTRTAVMVFQGQMCILLVQPQLLELTSVLMKKKSFGISGNCSQKFGVCLRSIEEKYLNAFAVTTISKTFGFRSPWLLNNTCLK